VICTLFTYVIPHSRMGSKDARCIPCVQVMTGENIMEKEKVVVFLDYANINRAATEKRCGLDYQHLLHYMGEERFLIEAYCYVPINPRREHRSDREIEEMWRSGYIVNTKVGNIAGETYK